jgi:CSLREA domain-containing protein
MAVAAGLLLAAAPACATEFHPVAGAADNGATDGICTLREAITAANETMAVPDCPVGSGLDTIVLSAGTYDIQLAGGSEDANATGDLDIADDVVVNGAGAGATTVDGHQLDRIFTVLNGVTATISGVTLTGGHAPDGTPHVDAPADPAQGGGAIGNDGTLTIDHVTITGNSAGDGAASGTISNFGMPGGLGGSGGAIASGGSLTVRNSTFTNNRAGNGGPGGPSGPGSGDSAGSGGQAGVGGAISGVGALTIENSTFSGNGGGNGGPGGTSASGTPGMGGFGGRGGAVSAGGPLTITGSTFTDNRGGDGGDAGPATNNGINPGGAPGDGGAIAVVSFGVDTSISDSTVTGNRAGDGGGGSSAVAPGTRGGAGGGIWIGAGDATIERTTVSGNRAGDASAGGQQGGGRGGEAGGVFAGGLTDLTLRASTVSANTAGNGANSDSGPPGHGGDGGGIYVGISSSKAFSATNVTVAGNSAGAAGSAKPAIDTVGGRGGHGGGIYLLGKATLTHVTIAGNQTGTGGGGETPGARGQGGGIHSASDTQTLANSVVASNAPVNCTHGAGTIADGGHDVSFPDTTCPGTGGDPLLGALAGNGGPAQTMALGEGSSAIDLVPSSGAGCAATDERGVTRPQRSACDAGAYEAEPPAAPPQAPGGTSQPPPTPAPAADRTPPRVRLLLFKQKLRKAVRKGYRCRFRTNEPGRAAASLRLKKKRVARGARVIGKAGRTTVVVKFTKKLRRKLAKRRRLVLRLTLVVKDAAGNRTTKRARVVLSASRSEPR